MMQKFLRVVIIPISLLFLFSKEGIAQVCSINSEIGSLESIHFIPPIYAKTGGLNSGNDIDQHYLLQKQKNIWVSFHKQH